VSNDCDEVYSGSYLCGNLCCSRSLRQGVCRRRPFRLERLWHERQCHWAVRARGLLAGARLLHRLFLCPRGVLRRMGAHSLHFFSPSKVAAVGAAVGGITLVGVLMAGGCFLIGCCGSPMLAVYVSLFGSRALGVGKPLTALVTLVSVSCGYWCLSRRLAHGGICCSSADTPQKTHGTDTSKVGPRKRSPHDQTIFR
jgi:hypothetical protein